MKIAYHHDVQVPSATLANRFLSGTVISIPIEIREVSCILSLFVFDVFIVISLSRYHRIAGRDVFFLTGTDEHGQKVADTAAAQSTLLLTLFLLFLLLLLLPLTLL